MVRFALLTCSHRSDCGVCIGSYCQVTMSFSPPVSCEEKGQQTCRTERSVNFTLGKKMLE